MARSPLQRFAFMACLVVAGEAIFSLPFHVARFFRPTVLSVLDFTNTELGAAQAAYGVTAMIAYFPGGPLADKFEARKLLTLSLVATGAGGFYFATFPPYRGMWLLFGYWGFSTILLFWAALIRATRDWGGHDAQGRAYGILDGGRGLFAAVMASGAALLFGWVFPEDGAAVTDEERRAALRAVIYVYAVVTICAAALMWLFVPPSRSANLAREQRTARELVAHVRRVLKLPAVWLQSLIVVSAYVAYKGFDNYSLFAHQAYGMSEVEVASFTSTLQWLRPVAAVSAGLLADRWLSSKVVVSSFALLIAGDLYFALGSPSASTTWLLFANATTTCIAMFGLRGVYFALFEEAAVPTAVTGTAVGLVSVIGYTPDIFVGVVAGAILDASPGVAGHQRFFWFLAGFSAVGLGATLGFQRTARGAPRPPAPPASGDASA